MEKKHIIVSYPEQNYRTELKENDTMTVLDGGTVVSTHINGGRLEVEKDGFAIAEEDPQMDDQIRAFIEKERGELTGTFCRNCGYCGPCTVGIEIHNCARMNMLLRRSPWQQYMTDEWYAKMQKINDCLKCGRCREKCPYNLDTPNLLRRNYDDFMEHWAHKEDFFK